MNGPMLSHLPNLQLWEMNGLMIALNPGFLFQILSYSFRENPNGFEANRMTWLCMP